MHTRPALLPAPAVRFRPRPLAAALLVAAAMALVLLLPARADSFDVTWTLDSVGFVNGAAATGTFLIEYDEIGTRECSDCPAQYGYSLQTWDISVAGGTFDGTTFSPSNSTASLTGTNPINDPLFDMLQPDPAELQFDLGDLDPNSPPVITDGFYTNDGNTTAFDPNSGGYLDASDPVPVPEPPTGLLLLSGGLGLLAWAERRRRAAATL